MLPEAVLIFGATGFVGRNLVATLSGKTRVVAISHSGASVLGADECVRISRINDIAMIPSDTVVINLAAKPYDASRFETAQSDILRANVDIGHKVYQFCVERGLKEVRVASSVAVYPAGLEYLDDEIAVDLMRPPNANESFYAWSKRWNEILAQLYASRFSISTLSFRLSNPYGPFDTLELNNAHVLPAFVMRALRPSGEFEIRGNPDTERDFIYVSDVCDIFAQSLSWRGCTDVFNLCTGTSTSLRDLAGSILRLLEDTRPIIASDAFLNSVSARRSKNKKLVEAFHKTSFVALDDGLARTIRWYADALKQ